MMKTLSFFMLLAGVLLLLACQNEAKQNKQTAEDLVKKTWTAEQAKAWGKEHGWLRGCN